MTEIDVPGEAAEGVRTVAGTVSVVVATRDRRDAVLGVLARLCALPERPQVILVDDGSTDGTEAAVAAAFPEVRVVHPTGPHGATTARNAGVRAARTPLVAFADDDSWWAPGALVTAADTFAAFPRLGLLAARILVGPEERLDPTCAVMAASPLPADGLPGPRLLGFIACGAVVRREAFLAAGGFPRHYVIGGEEEPLALALATAGWDLAYVEGVVAHHHPGAVTRDHGGRDRIFLRNDLWTAWTHRPWPGALHQTARLLRRARTVPHLHGVVQALAGLPRILPRRRPVPAHVEAQRRLLAVMPPPGAPPAPARSPRRPAPWTAGAARRRAARSAVRVSAHHRPRTPRAGDPRLAVVVAPGQGDAALAADLAHLAALPERPHVVVVDDGATRGRVAAVRSAHPWVELLVVDGDGGGAVARNAALGQLGQPYVAFAGDGTRWAPGALARAADLLDASPDVAAVTGRTGAAPAGVDDPTAGDPRWSPLADDPDLPGHPLLRVPAGASVVRRSALVRSGGFEPLLRGDGQELLAVDLAAAGWALRFVPELVVHRDAPPAADPRRRADELRDALVTTWLRRPLPRAAWRTALLLRRAPRGTALQAVAAATAVAPAVARERRRVPGPLEAELRRLDVQQLRAPAPPG